MPNVQHKRGTKAALDALAAGGELKAGQLYLISDEARIAAALSPSSYQAFAKKGEAAGASTIVKAVDETRVSTATFAADGELRATLGVGRWRLRLFAFIAASGSSASGFKYQTTFSGTASARFIRRHMSPGAAAGTDAVTEANGSGQVPATSLTFTTSSGVGSIEINMALDVTGAGEWQLQWAQNASSVHPAICGLGSTLELFAA
jgi:hypothetical protein